MPEIGHEQTTVEKKEKPEGILAIKVKHYNQEVLQYFLVENGSGSKWMPTHKVYEQLSEKLSRGQKAFKLLPFAILMLNLLY